MTTVDLEAGIFRLDGEARVLLCASLFPFRIPREEWGERIAAVARLGYHCLDVYIPWNFHEADAGEWDFTGRRDVGEFLRLAAEAGMLVLARPGPYICSEWDGGGLPARLSTDEAGRRRLRQNDAAFLDEVAGWYAQVMPLLAAHQATRGGPVIAVQLENELDFFDCDDPAGYVGALRDLALEHGIDVPLIACAGQGDVERAGGWVEGVAPAVNLYPEDDAREVEALAEHYDAVVRDRGFPLMATETNRLHRTLKRLVVGGVRLLGPYLQASGWNFGYTTAVNNWGALLGFLAHDYDFGGALRPDGTQRPDAADGRRLAGTIEALGARLAAGVPRGPARGVQRSGPAPHALELAGGGELLAVCALGEEAESFALEWPAAAGDEAARIDVDVVPGDGLLLVRGLPLGDDLELTLTTAELVGWTPGPEAVLEFVARGRETLVLSGAVTADPADGDGPEVRDTPDGLTVHAASGAVTVRTPTGSYNLVFRPAEVAGTPPSDPRRTVDAVQAGEAASLWTACGTADEPASLERLGIFRGAARYTAETAIPGIRGIVLKDAADVISLEIDGRPGPWSAHAGESVWLPGRAEEVRRLAVTARVWGHANFDDGRLPSLRLGSGRGVSGVLAVDRETTLAGGWEVSGAPAGGLSPHVGAPAPWAGVGSWMTARFPQRVVYRRVLEVAADGALRFDGIGARVDVRVNGELRGTATPHCPVVWLGSIERGDELSAEVWRTWGEAPGEPVLLTGHRVRRWTVERQDERDLRRSRDAAHRASLTLPLAVPAGGARWLRLEAADLEVRHPSTVVGISGDGVHVTALCGDEMLGRVWVSSPPGATLKGGRGDHLLVPGAWRGRGLDLLVEATGHAPGRVAAVHVGGAAD